MNKIKVERKIHDLWRGQEYAKKLIKHKIPSIIGKYHYRYSSKKGTMSLISIFSIGGNKIEWEICGGKVGKEQRFTTKSKADKLIRSLLS